MQLKLPRTPRFLSTHPAQRGKPPRPEDDPWAGEDEEWQSEEHRSRVHPAAVARFFRAVALAVLVGLVFWAALVLLILRLT
jgi:hypothetical protein